MKKPDENIFIESVSAALSGMKPEISVSRGEVEVRLLRGKLVEAFEKLRDAPTLRFVQLMDICGVDFPERAERFEIVYQLLSLQNNERLRVIVRTDEKTPVPSVCGLFPSAGWFEREIFDLFGVSFEGHPDLRRILTDYGFEGYPLRRDFPLLGFTQKRYDDLTRRVVEEPIALQQDYRAFNASGPWQGLTDVQKRGEKQ